MSEFSPKSPTAKPILTMDFTDRLEGRVIQSATWTILSETGATQDSYLLKGSIDISAKPLVRQQVEGGTVNTRYLHRCDVTTTNGEVVTGDVWQTVKLGA